MANLHVSTQVPEMSGKNRPRAFRLPPPRRDPPEGKGGCSAYASYRKQAGYATFISQPSVRRAIENGWVTRPDKKTGWLDFKKADTELLEHEAEAAIEKATRGGISGDRFREARTLREEMQAKKAQLDVAIKLGLLCKVEDVKAEQKGILRRVRDRLLSIPDRLSTELAAATEAGYVHERLANEINTALDEARAYRGRVN